MKTRIKALVVVVMATAAMVGVLAAPASAVVPLVLVRVQCVSTRTNTPVTLTFPTLANGIGKRRLLASLDRSA